MPDTKFRPTGTMKSKDKSNKQRFGHVNVTNPNSYFNILLLNWLQNKWKIYKNLKLAFLRFLGFFCKPK